MAFVGGKVHSVRQSARSELRSTAPSPLPSEPVVAIGGSLAAGLGNLIQFEFKEAVLNWGLGTLGSLGRLGSQVWKVASKTDKIIKRIWEGVFEGIERWLDWQIDPGFG